jgi:hypothetical protein
MSDGLPRAGLRPIGFAARLRARWRALLGGSDRRPRPTRPARRPPPDDQREREGVESVLVEIELLLGYLDGLLEAPLDRRFARPGAVPAPGPGVAVTPPTRDRTYFLARIAAIARAARGPGEAAYDPGRVTEAAPLPPGDDHGPWLNDLAFLLWARYFLAAAAFPDSVETIRATRAVRQGRDRGDRGGGLARLGGDREAPLEAFGHRIVRHIAACQALTVVLILLSIWSSYMVFTGSVMIRESRELERARAALIERALPARQPEPLRGI